MTEYHVPHALEEADIARIVPDYAKPAYDTIDLGLDGIELHSANGCQLHQFCRRT